MINGGAAANAHSQEHVEHVNNRLAIYVAYGAHATYFAADTEIEVPDVGAVLGIQDQYDPDPDGVFDVTSPSQSLPAYQLKNIDTSSFGSFIGHWGFFDPADVGVNSKNAPSGPPLRAAKTSGGGQVVLRSHPKTLHNMSRKNSQADEMFIP